MVPPTKYLSENLNLYYQVYCQVVPPTTINSLENLKIVYYDSGVGEGGGATAPSTFGHVS